MIGRISGSLIEKTPLRLLIDCQGLGYEVDVPMSTFYTLPDVGQLVVLWTQLIVREDAHLLYGFASTEERTAFRELLKISGIGARMALAVLSGMSVGDLAQAVAQQETARLIRVPGIGKKTAERLLLELKGKLGQFTMDTTTGKQINYAQANHDITQALMALGYSEKEAYAAYQALPDNVSTTEGIRQALKNLSKS